MTELGSELPHDRRYFVHKRILGAAKSFVKSGFNPVSAVGGFLAPTSRPRRPVSRIGPVGQVFPSSNPRPVTRIARLTRGGADPRGRGFRGANCFPGFELVGGLCLPIAVSRIASPIFGALKSRFARPTRRGPRLDVQPFQPTSIAPSVGAAFGPARAVEGAFGMPAFEPEGEFVQTLRCPKGMVLGMDDLCYPKAVLPRRSKFRKWRGQARPPVSAGDAKAIRRAASARERVLTLAKNVGLHASKTKPSGRSRGRSKGHQHLLAAPSLQVISEETN